MTLDIFEDNSHIGISGIGVINTLEQNFARRTGSVPKNKLPLWWRSIVIDLALILIGKLTYHISPFIEVEQSTPVFCRLNRLKGLFITKNAFEEFEITGRQNIRPINIALGITVIHTLTATTKLEGILYHFCAIGDGIEWYFIIAPKYGLGYSIIAWRFRQHFLFMFERIILIFYPYSQQYYP